jgi:hypothetical protein
VDLGLHDVRFSLALVAIAAAYAAVGQAGATGYIAAMGLAGFPSEDSPATCSRIAFWMGWYSWVGSNHRPPDPQSGALTN